MPKKRGQKKITNQDFTINDSANAPKPVRRVKKSTASEQNPELSWEQLADDDFDFVEEVDAEGVKQLVRKKRNHSKSSDNLDDCPGVVYPEIIWYYVSNYISPEHIGKFALINKACYLLTTKEAFWRKLYMVYCGENSWLPQKLRLEINSKSYGLRQRVIRALHYTYYPFLKKIESKCLDTKPHSLVKRRCVSVWFKKRTEHWCVCFKFKKVYPKQRINHVNNFLEELSRIDANPEEDTQVLEVSCKMIYEVPPIMGMTLLSVNVTLSQGFTAQRLNLGFHSSNHHFSRDTIPECLVVFDSVSRIQVFDWWHPLYPHFDDSMPCVSEENTLVPMLNEDF